MQNNKEPLIQERQKIILDYLLKEESLTAGAFSKLMRLSTKTVRNEINVLKPIVSKYGGKIEAKPGVGYSLQINNKMKFRSLTKELDNYSHNKKWTGQSYSHRRAHMIIRFLLAHNNYLTIDDLVDLMFTSRTTINKDLQLVKKELAIYGMSLEKKPYYGLKIKGNEHQIRMCLIDEYAHYLHDENVIKETKYKHIMEIDDDEYNILQSIVYRSLEAYPNIVIAYPHIDRIIRSLHLLPYRMDFSLADCYEQNQIYIIQQQETYFLAKKILSQYAEIYLYDRSRDEQIFLAVYLNGLRDYGNYQYLEKLPQYYNLYNFAEELIDELAVRNGFTELDSDIKILNDLTKHFLSMKYRIEYFIRIDFSLNREIRLHSGAMDLAIQSADILSVRWGKTIDENEIGFLATVFMPAFGRYKTVNKKRNIGIISSVSQNFGNHVRDRFIRNFGNYVGDIKVLTTQDLNNLTNNDIYCVFSDVPNNYLPNVDVPVFPYSPFFDEKDKLQMRYYLTVGNDSFEKLTNFLSPKFVFSDLSADSEGEALKVIYDNLRSAIPLTESFYRDIVRRDNIYSSDVGNGVSLLKTLTTQVDHVFFSFYIFNKPFYWNTELVQLVILWHHNNNDEMSVELYESGFFGRVLRKFITSQQLINEFLQNPTYEILLDIIGKIKKDI